MPVSPLERKYLSAKVDIGPVPHVAGEVAARLGRQVKTLTAIRNSLIAKGLIYCQKKWTELSRIPFIGGFMKRSMASEEGFDAEVSFLRM